MRLILEGIDGAGKTTILETIERLQREKGIGCACTVRHLDKPPKGVTPHQWSDYFREHYDQAHLLSRSHVSERVYGTLIRKKSLIDDWQNWLLTLQLQVRGFRIAYVTAPSDQMKARILSRGEKASDYDRWVVDHLEEMNRLYIESLPPHLVTLVLNQDGRLGAAIEQCLAISESPFETNYVELRGIGSLTPKFLLLGDELTRRRWDFPHAKPFDFGEAAKMVFRALGHRYDFYMTNTRFPDLGDIRSQFQLESELKRFPGVPIIALGNEALTRLRKIGKEAASVVPHPQYWRRFKYHDQEAWVEDLKQVAGKVAP